MEPVGRHMPQAPHEMMQDIFPRLKGLMKEVAPKCRKHLRASRTISLETLVGIPQIVRFLDAITEMFFFELGYTWEGARGEADILGNHCYYMVNYEIHHRKMFWVDGPLAEMFHLTELDIEGDALLLPFPTCAFSFTDGQSLELAKALLNLDEEVSKERDPSILTVYMIAEEVANDARGLNAFVLVGCRDEEWPYLLARSMLIHPHDRLDRILESHLPDVVAETRDPVFTSPELKKVMHLVFNAILYSTTRDLSAVMMPSPVSKLKKRARKAKSEQKRQLERQYREARKANSEDEVFFLPGKIDIMHRPPDDDNGPIVQKEGSLTYRFMVRGHWRKANPGWKDQSLRWIHPYYKGPEDAPIVEKDYRLKT